ncbi:hypothetical protein [Metabacillus litoralis]|uniref:hypothetical protein n=1 Tax=Metabacillus litoralis TaxID=152268 RepID=UPI00203A63BB|nr:hypothetical protein [Metabacillus litoralis]MCM3650956.1 hypothetical protein [Metabacillus litoralis]
MKKAYYSKRIYKNMLPKVYVDAISHSFLLFNRAKHFTFQTQVVEKSSGKNKRDKSLHLTVKKRFNMNDYYTNSVVQEANALMTSQSELKKCIFLQRKNKSNPLKRKSKRQKVESPR